MKREENFVKTLDTTCRDGMHAIAHQFTAVQVGALAKAAETYGADYFEVSHGDGLSGASIIYGLCAEPEEKLLRAAGAELKKSRLAALFLPGIGVKSDLEMAVDCGLKMVRIAAHCTEATVTPQDIGNAKALGLEVFGVLMMIHAVTPQQLLEQARLMESYGADAVYCMDSAGHLLPEGIKPRIAMLAENLKIPVGFHAHNNLSMAVANSLAALQAGASFLDGSLCGLGAGAGNTPIEVLAAVLKISGYESNLDMYRALDAAEEVLVPMLARRPTIDSVAVAIGMAGVYGSFALHAKRAAERYGVDARDILAELGRMKVVGGQEDKIVEVALKLTAAKKEACS
jgi:4-hydroxy 2-oxovalerate aldolase